MDNTQRAITPEHAIRVLNEALALDHESIRNLFAVRHLATPALGAHPSIQVRSQGGDRETVGLLGLLNGIFGTRPDGWGFISAVYETSAEGVERLERFELTAPGPFKANDVSKLAGNR